VKPQRLAALAAAFLLASCAGLDSKQAELDRIQTIVVLYAENHSFDNMYGMFPGAEGVANATEEQKRQVDHDGTPLSHLPPVYNAGKIDTRYPLRMPNGPFRIDQPPVNARIDQVVPSPIHNYYQNIEQINGGKNNKFVAMTTVGAWTMGYYDGSGQRMWEWAKRYTLADHFFMGAFGGSFLNHQWLICACTPFWPEAPIQLRAQLDANGRLKRRPDSNPSVLQGPVAVFDGGYSPEGYAVNTAQPAYQPSGIPPGSALKLEIADPTKFPLPPQTAKTIGDTLSAKNVSWAWYSGGWDAAVKDGTRLNTEKRQVIYTKEGDSPNFQAHHQPFNYYARFAPGTPDRKEHLRDGRDFEEAIEKGTLPAVSFYKPSGRLNQHPSYTDIQSGDVHISELLAKLEKSPQWKNMVVIVTYDENGGYWDHVPPPSGEGWGDRWGPGTRIPTLIVSPFAKRGFVDHTTYDTTSILKLITERFRLEPLPGVRKNMGDLTNALELK
jgi:acid phosphatase